MAMLNDVKAYGTGYVPIPFSFAPNGTSAVAASSIKGMDVVSVTRSNPGIYAVVFRSPIYDVLCFTPSIQLDSAAATVVSWDWASSTKTLTITVMKETADPNSTTDTKFQADDTAANADNRIGGVLWVRTSSVGK